MRMGQYLDNIYVVNFLVNRQLKRKGGMVVAVFLNLKATFDSLDRKVLFEEMRERWVREGLRSRIKEVYMETRSKVWVGEGIGENICTARGVRQGCPMSPCLFNLVLAHVEEAPRRLVLVWGNKTGEEKVHCLSYADDMALLAENEKGMVHMLGKLEGNLD